MKRIRKDTPLYGISGDLGLAIGFALRKMYFIQGQKRGKRQGITVYDATLAVPCATVIDGAWVILNEEWVFQGAPLVLLGIAKGRLAGEVNGSIIQDAITESWIKFQEKLQKSLKSV